MKLIEKYRLELIEVAAQQHVPDLIFTFVYAKGEDENFIEAVIERVEKYQGNIYFVQLTCSPDELVKRINNPERKNFRKLKDAQELDKVIEKYDLFSRFSAADSLSIDTGKISPEDAAKQIKEHYQL